MTTTISTERRYRPICDSHGSSASVASVVMSPPNTEAVKRQHDRLLRLALLRHRVAVERGRRRAARAGNLDQDRRDAAGQVVRAVQRDHEGERLLDRNRRA